MSRIRGGGKLGASLRDCTGYPNTRLGKGVRTKRAIAANKARSAQIAEATAQCLVCGATALYRVYTAGSAPKNFGACAKHRDQVKKRTEFFRGE